MKSLLVKAVASAIALGTLASCSGLEVASKSESKPYLLSKAKANQFATGGSSGWLHGGASSGFLPATADVGLKHAAAALPKDKHGLPTYHSEGTRHRYVRTTAYSCQENEVGACGRLNAMGTILKYGHVRSAAADWSRYPVGTTFKIKGLPHIYVVDDYGSALVGTNTIDIYHPTLDSMRAWATRDVEINIVRWGSWEHTANLLRGRTKYNHCAQMYYATVRRMSSGHVARHPTGVGVERPAL